MGGWVGGWVGEWMGGLVVLECLCACEKVFTVQYFQVTFISICSGNLQFKMFGSLTFQYFRFT